MKCVEDHLQWAQCGLERNLLYFPDDVEKRVPRKESWIAMVHRVRQLNAVCEACLTCRRLLFLVYRIAYCWHENRLQAWHVRKLFVDLLNLPWLESSERTHHYRLRYFKMFGDSVEFSTINQRWRHRRKLFRCASSKQRKKLCLHPRDRLGLVLGIEDGSWCACLTL